MSAEFEKRNTQITVEPDGLVKKITELDPSGITKEEIGDILTLAIFQAAFFPHFQTEILYKHPFFEDQTLPPSSFTEIAKKDEVETRRFLDRKMEEISNSYLLIVSTFCVQPQP